MSSATPRKGGTRVVPPTEVFGRFGIRPEQLPHHGVTKKFRYGELGVVVVVVEAFVAECAAQQVGSGHRGYSPQRCWR